MYQSKQMRAIIDELARTRGMHLDEPGTWFKLELGAGWMPLVVENVGQSLISVAHYFEQNGDLVPDPEIVFYTGDHAGWIPVECQMAIGTLTICARVTQGVLVAINPPAAADVASFADTWAGNLRDQGWLEHAHTAKQAP